MRAGLERTISRCVARVRDWRLAQRGGHEEGGRNYTSSVRQYAALFKDEVLLREGVAEETDAVAEQDENDRDRQVIHHITVR